MTELAAVALTFLISYLIGAVPFGYLVARGRGVDIFQQGSGNIGATNVGRVLGHHFGVLVFLLDFAKGALPVTVARWVAQHPAWGIGDSLPPGSLPVVAGLATLLGHLFPVYLRFRGGKGVATGAGVVAVLLPGPALGAAVAWLAVLLATRFASLASMVAGFVLCLIHLGLAAEPFAAAHFVVTAFCLVAAGLIVVRHHANIGRLMGGTENRVKDTPAMFQLTKVIHVLALGLWFGSAVFFSFVAALLLFQTFEGIGAAAPEERPSWLPLSPGFDKESGTRLAGVAVAPMFPWYYALQGACGLLAVATALSWTKPGRGVHKLRSALLVTALLTVFVGWPLVQKVSDLRIARYALDPAISADARAAFGGWHAASLLLNLITIALVTVAMALTAWLPAPLSAADEKHLLGPAG